MQRFWDKVDKSGDCWEWTGAVGAGYGQISYQGKPVYAHRFVSGPLSSSAVVLHRCDNKTCVNPDHLTISTQSENMSDMVAKDRQAKGSDHRNAKLDEGSAARVKDMLSMGVSQRVIADWFGVSQQLISRINTGINWKHV